MTTLEFIRQNGPFLAAGVLLTFLSSFGQTFFISAFAGEVRGEFNLTHGGWGSAYSLATFASALVVVWVGLLTDRYRVRSIGLWVMLMLAVAACLMAVGDQLVVLVVAVFLLRLGGQGMANHLATVAMARWYVATRGRALSIAYLGVAAGEAFLPMIVVAAMAEVSWRTLWGLAAVVIVMLIPLLLRLLKLERTPSSIAEETESTGLGGRHWTRAQLLRNRLFWLCLPYLLGPAAFGTAFFFHQVHLAEFKGWGHGTLVAMFPLFTGTAIAALFASGWLIDRVGAMRLLPLTQLPTALGFLLFGIAETPWLGGFAMILMGLTQGANSTIPAAFWAEAYGTRHLGAIKSLASAVMVFGTAIGPILTGILIDRGLPYTAQMPFVSVYFVISAILISIGLRAARSSPATQVDV